MPQSYPVLQKQPTPLRANTDHLALVPLINRNGIIETQQQECSYSVITITNKNNYLKEPNNQNK